MTTAHEVLRSLADKFSSDSPSRFRRACAELRKLGQHTIYVRILTLLLCIALTSILIQAGSLFLIDYIPVSHSVTNKIHEQQLHWKGQLELARASSARDAETILNHLSEKPLDARDREVVWLIRRDRPNLSTEVGNITAAEERLRRAREEDAPIATRLLAATRLR